MNPTIYMTRLSGIALLTMSAEEDPLYPANNLLDYNPLKIWRGPLTAGQTLVYDFGREVRKNCIVMHGHNLEKVGGYKVESSPDPAFGDGTIQLLIDDPDIDEKSIFAREFRDLNAEEQTDELFNDINRYIRITIGGSIDPLQVRPEIANLFIGALFRFRYPPEQDFKFGIPIYETNASKSVSGIIRSSQTHGRRRRFELRQSMIESWEHADMIMAFDYIRGGLHPFYFTHDEGLLPRLVRSVKDSLSNQHRIGVYYDSDTLTFEEVLPSDDINDSDRYAGQHLRSQIPFIGA